MGLLGPMDLIERELKSLMIAALAGDERAYRNLLDRLSGYLRGYYKGRLEKTASAVGDAEDLVQETLMALHLRRHTFDPEQPFTPWLYAIARYKLIDYLRRTRGSSANVAIEDVENVIARDDQAASESSLDLDQLLERLPPKIRAAIRHVKLDGLSVAEAAARTGMSESAVKVSVHRGIKALSASIRERRS
jgi:RNA polymerase sigma-70 factor (ECF subfamily)